MVTRRLPLPVLWLAVGCGLGAVVPLPALDGPGGDGAPLLRTPVSAPAADITAPEAAPAAEIEAFADPCLGIKAAERRVDELATQVERARASFQHRFGEPIPAPPDFDPDGDALRWSSTLEGYPDHLWSTVDCTLYPCVGLIVTDKPLPTSTSEKHVRDLIGMPDAWVLAETPLADGRAMSLVKVGFIDEELELDRNRWLISRTTRAQQLYGTEIRAALEAVAPVD